MITFNATERVTPTVVRRRIKTVKRELEKQLRAETKAKLDHDLKENELTEAKTKLSNCHRKSQALSDQLVELQDKEVELKKRSSRQIVTDHAVVQFIERVLGVDVQSIRNQILGKDGKTIRNMEEDGHIERDHYSLVIADGVVTTILADGMVDLNPTSESTHEVAGDD